MEINLLAGKPAEPEMLVNVPKLVTAYYTESPDPSVPAQRVMFGTSGIAVQHSTKHLTNGIFSPSLKLFVSIAVTKKLMALCF